MVRLRHRSLVCLTLMLVSTSAFLFASGAPAAASLPGNDDFSSAKTVGTMPFHDDVDTRAATVAPDDPPVSGRDCPGEVTHTVWYRFTAPRSQTYALDTLSSTYDTTVAVYTGGRGSLTLVECSGVFGGYLRGRLLLAAQAGLTYHVMIGATEGPGGTLRFAVDESPVEPLEVTIGIEWRAHLAPNGEIVVAGSVTCSRRAEVGLDGAVDQGPTHSFFFPEPFACGPDGTTFRAATRERQGDRFRVGRATALVVAYGWDEYDRDTPETEVDIDVVAGRIVYARSAGRSDRPASVEIFSMEADGAGVVRLTRNSTEDAYPVISPDGESVAFARRREGRYDLFVKDLTGGRATRVTRTPARNETLPAWSPDGFALAYTVWFNRRAGSQSDVFWRWVAGGHPHRLTDTSAAHEFAPEWSPDGWLIAFTKWSPKRHRYGIGVYDFDADRTRWLTHNPRSRDGYSDMNPTWSPDGQWVAFSREHGGDAFVDIYKVDRDGMNLMPVTELGELAETATWGPDDRIAFQHDAGIAIVGADGLGLVHITETGTNLPFHWPDW